MVKPRGQQTRTTKPLPRRRIGFIGKSNINPKEAGLLWDIGRCIAIIGHTVILAPAKGATVALREGIKVEGGSLEEVKSNIIEQADHTLIYPDTQLLERLREKYDDIEARDNVLIIHENQLDEWHAAVQYRLLELGHQLPD